METNALQKVAEKSIVADIVGGVVGGIVGCCATEVTQGIIEQTLPKPKDLKMKVVYGIGSYAIGGLVGQFAQETMTNAMNELSGGLLTVKATVEEVLKAMNNQEQNEN